MLTRTPENGPCNRFPRKKNVEDKVISRFETNLRGLAMKFAHELDDARAVSDPLWRDAFIDYKRLKKIVSRRRRGSSAASAGDARSEEGEADQHDGVTAEFLRALQEEADRVNAFVSLQSERARAEAASIDESRRASPASAVTQRAKLVERTRLLYESLARLGAFVELSYTSFYKAAKKLDKSTHQSLAPELMRRVELQPFMRLRENVVASALRAEQRLFAGSAGHRETDEDGEDGGDAVRDGAEGSYEISSLRSTNAALRMRVVELETERSSLVRELRLGGGRRGSRLGRGEILEDPALVDFDEGEFSSIFEGGPRRVSVAAARLTVDNSEAALGPAAAAPGRVSACERTRGALTWQRAAALVTVIVVWASFVFLVLHRPSGPPDSSGGSSDGGDSQAPSASPGPAEPSV